MYSRNNNVLPPSTKSTAAAAVASVTTALFSNHFYCLLQFKLGFSRHLPWNDTGFKLYTLLNVGYKYEC